MHYFRVSTSQKITAADFDAALHDLKVAVESRSEHEDRIEAVASDGSIYSLKSISDGNGYFHFDAKFHLLENQIEFAHVASFAKYCDKRDLGLRYKGADTNVVCLLDDVTRSEAYRIASHRVCHPNDKQSKHNMSG